MKLYSKETMLLGGLYTVLAIPFTYFNEAISGILLLLFIGLAIILFFKKKLRKISLTFYFMSSII